MLLGYARVSTDEQDSAAQRRALLTAGCERIFEETASGGRWDRPQLQELLRQLRKDDIVVVWKLDRLSRSLKDVLHLMERLGEAGAGFRSLTEAIDTTTPAGRMMTQMVGAFAEFEREMIRERTRAGLDAARAEGRFPERPEEISPGVIAEIAGRAGVDEAEWPRYDWGGRAWKLHRRQIREALGFRPATVEDADRLTEWLRDSVVGAERRLDHLTVRLREHCRMLSIEPPSTERIQRVLARPHWEGELTQEDLRALTPLIWEHVNPCGTYQLDLDTRLVLD